MFAEPHNAIGTMKTSGVWHHYAWDEDVMVFTVCTILHIQRSRVTLQCKSDFPVNRSVLIQNEKWRNSWTENENMTTATRCRCQHDIGKQQFTEGDLWRHSNSEGHSLVDLAGICAREVLHTVVMDNHNCCRMQWVKPRMVYMQLLQASMKWTLKNKVKCFNSAKFTVCFTHCSAVHWKKNNLHEP